ncbi:DUF6879 family protein [Streptosporangium saharense]|uniref:DUF6879 family protein n=1 Tax=Streptosporangium saharense TaxID=1706840 RepID=UPI0036C4F3AD
MTDLFDKAERSIVRLELRDTYGTTSASYQAWQAGRKAEEFADFEPYRPWVGLVQRTVSRGVSIRRTRVISEPVSDYIRFEHAVTPYSNLVGGEQIRWLPRRLARSLSLPICEFWQFDEGLVFWVFQAGSGASSGYELSEDPAEVELCRTAFEAAWNRGLDHEKYRPA